MISIHLVVLHIRLERKEHMFLNIWWGMWSYYSVTRNHLSATTCCPKVNYYSQHHKFLQKCTSGKLEGNKRHPLNCMGRQSSIQLRTPSRGNGHALFMWQISIKTFLKFCNPWGQKKFQYCHCCFIQLFAGNFASSKLFKNSCCSGQKTIIFFFWNLF